MDSIICIHVQVYYIITIPHSNRNDTVTVNSMILSGQILGAVSFTHPIELNFRLTVSETV